MSARFSGAAKAFFSPEAFVPFLVGSAFLGVLTNALYQVIANLVGTDTRAALAVAGGAVVILLASVLAWRWAFARSLRRAESEPRLGKRRPRRRGLVLLVSRAEPCRRAIGYHRPVLERCWLVCSVKTMDLARQLRSEFPNVCSPDPVVVNDVEDPLDYRRCVDGVYRSLPQGWAESDVICDYVGMTVHGTAGMVLACLPRGRPLQCTTARRDDALDAVEALDPIEIVLGEPGGQADEPEASDAPAAGDAVAVDPPQVV